jgi:hypothetical protein
VDVAGEFIVPVGRVFFGKSTLPVNRKNAVVRVYVKRRFISKNPLMG